MFAGGNAQCQARIERQREKEVVVITDDPPEPGVTQIAVREQILHALGISRDRLNRYTRPVSDELIQRIEQHRPRTKDQLNRIWYGYHINTICEESDLEVVLAARSAQAKQL